MSQVSYGTITITDTTDKIVYIGYAEDAQGTNLSNIPSNTRTYVGININTHDYSQVNPPLPPANDEHWTWSEYVGGDGVSVKQTKPIYFLKRTTDNEPTAPGNTVNVISNSTDANIWTTAVPTYIPNAIYYTSIQTDLDNNLYPHSTAVVDQALTDMNYNAYMAKSIAQHANEDAQGAMSQATATQVAQEALASSLRKIWINEVTRGDYVAGTYAASGLSDGPDSNFDTTNPSTYGFNSLLRHTYLSFRYNTNQLVTIGSGISTPDGAISGLVINTPILTNNVVTNVARGMELTNSSLKFYHAPTVSGSTVTSGSKAMELTDSMLQFFNADDSVNPQVQFDTNGILLGKENSTNEFNIKISKTAVTENSIQYGPGILLRKGSTVLNEITADGMNLYGLVGDGTMSQWGRQAHFGSNIILGDSNSGHVLIDSIRTQFKYNNLIYGSIDSLYRTFDMQEEFTYSSNTLELDVTDESIKYTPVLSSVTGYFTIKAYGTTIVSDAIDLSQDCTDVTLGSITIEEGGIATAIIFTLDFSSNWPSRDDTIVSNPSFTMHIEGGTTSTPLEVQLTLQYSAKGSKYRYYFGKNVQSVGDFAFATGDNTLATNYCQFVTGKYNKQDDDAMFIIGNGTDDTHRSNLMTISNDEVNIGNNNKGHTIIDENGMRIYGGDGTQQLANIGYGEGQAQSGTAVAPYYTLGIRASGSTVGNYSVAEGAYTIASGYHSHAEGYQTTASGPDSHAEGDSTTARGRFSHAEGYQTTASNIGSHAEGYHTTASEYYSHAEGTRTIASGQNSHAQNTHTIAQRKSQTALGEYNETDTSGTDGSTRGDYAVIVGNGTADDARSNALTIDWNGNVKTAGDVIDGSSNVLSDKANSTDVYTSQSMAGVIQMFAGSTAPIGWLICDGSAVSRETYKTLFDVIGTTYGSGDGSTTFNLPDFSGRIPVGVGTASANTDGTPTNATAHTLSEKKGNEDLIVPYHRHGITSVLETNGVAIAANRVGTVTSGGVTYALRKTNNDIAGVTNTAYSSNDSTNATGANMMPYLTINYIICTGKTS